MRLGVFGLGVYLSVCVSLRIIICVFIWYAFQGIQPISPSGFAPRILPSGTYRQDDTHTHTSFYS